jgi:hypothetical protein
MRPGLQVNAIMISAKCQCIEASEGIKGIPFRSASLFFNPSRNSVTHQEETQVSAVDKTLQLIPPKEEAAASAIGAATTMGSMALGTIIGLTVDFGGPLAEDFLQTA